MHEFPKMIGRCRRNIKHVPKEPFEEAPIEYSKSRGTVCSGVGICLILGGGGGGGGGTNASLIIYMHNVEKFIIKYVVYNVANKEMTDLYTLLHNMEYKNLHISKIMEST